MTIQYKAVGAQSLAVADEGEGIVTALVSVTGLVDDVKDVIEPGAYTKSLAKRRPKGVWHHTWEKAITKTLDVKELFPGDPALPDTLPNGNPWPKNAGGLLVKMQFNLKTQRGRDAYEDVKFYGDEQEWSIGYSVPDGGATRKDGVRYIKQLELFEYSPVLFGAMSNARTVSVKSAQEAFREAVELKGENAAQFLMEVKSFLNEDLGEKTVESDTVDEEDDVVEEKGGKGKQCSPAELARKRGEKLKEDEEPFKDDDEDDFIGEFDDDKPRGKRGEKSYSITSKQAADLQGFMDAVHDILQSATKGGVMDGFIDDEEDDEADDLIEDSTSEDVVEEPTGEDDEEPDEDKEEDPAKKEVKSGSVMLDISDFADLLA